MDRKVYLVKTSIEGTPVAYLKTEEEIADLYYEDQLCGIYGEIAVYDIEGEPKRVSLLDMVAPILENRRWMEQEYRDYCENERY